MIYIIYNHSVDKFEEIPHALYGAMDLQDGPWWYYAKYNDSKVSGRQYFIIGGLAYPLACDCSGSTDKAHPAKQKEKEESDVVLVLRRGKFQVVDNVVGYDDPVNHLPRRVIEGLSQDGAERLIRAFGSAASIDKAILETWKDSGGIAKVSDMPFYKALRAVGVKNICADPDAPPNSFEGQCKSQSMAPNGAS
ncbi:MAG TPA: hypothetical protein VGT99_13835 [Gammaproteobacteria bacterium]|nr:hypothetical protein [Gammaproteobacteria bacterium]